jgi:hypothetical protein
MLKVWSWLLKVFKVSKVLKVLKVLKLWDPGPPPGAPDHLTELAVAPGGGYTVHFEGVGGSLSFKTLKL